MEHILTLSQKNSLSITKVDEVLDFDEKEITLNSGEDKITVKGNNLRIISFDKNSGNFQSSGEVYSIVYGKNLPTLKKLFK